MDCYITLRSTAFLCKLGSFIDAVFKTMPYILAAVSTICAFITHRIEFKRDVVMIVFCIDILNMFAVFPDLHYSLQVLK